MTCSIFKTKKNLKLRATETAQCQALIDAGLNPPVEVFITSNGWAFDVGNGKIVDGFKEKRIAQAEALKLWMNQWLDTMNS